MKRIVFPSSEMADAERRVMPAGSPGMSSFQTSRRPVTRSSRKTRAGSSLASSPRNRCRPSAENRKGASPGLEARRSAVRLRPSGEAIDVDSGPASADRHERRCHPTGGRRIPSTPSAVTGFADHSRQVLGRRTRGGRPGSLPEKTIRLGRPEGVLRPLEEAVVHARSRLSGTASRGARRTPVGKQHDLRGRRVKRRNSGSGPTFPSGETAG